jgi:hypothetical protein
MVTIPKDFIIITLSAGLLIGCNSKGNHQDQQTEDLHSSQETPGKSDPLDIAAIEDALGMKGTENDGEYKVTVPQNDLNIIVDDFKIIPPMGLGSWAAFAPAADGAMVMGDVVVTENDLKPVQQEVIRQGLTITAIHNHFVRNTPNVMYMHIGGMGDEGELVAKVKAVFDKVEEVRGGNPAEKPASEYIRYW